MTAFHPGLPDADEFPFNTWSRLLTRRAKLARDDLFGTYFITGYPELRAAIARYLVAFARRRLPPRTRSSSPTARSRPSISWRGSSSTPATRSGWRSRATTAPPPPSSPPGARLAPLHVDDAGWRLEPPAPPAPRAIFVTPSCHHPLGLTMSMGQRLDLIRLADRWGAWIIEDDYDSEYRFQGQPIPALQGVAPERADDLRRHLRQDPLPRHAPRLHGRARTRFCAPVKAALSTTGQHAPLLTQAALADFINEGHLTRHLRRMRRLYAQRRETFMPAFEAALGAHLALRRTDTGIQLVATFRRPTDDRRFAAAAIAAGVNVSPYSLQFRHGGGTPGLVLGFAATGDRAQGAGCRGSPGWPRSSTGERRAQPHGRRRHPRPAPRHPGRPRPSPRRSSGCPRSRAGCSARRAPRPRRR